MTNQGASQRPKPITRFRKLARGHFNPCARVARRIRTSRSASSSSFNPRAPMGRDRGYAAIECIVDMFQPTRPYGARRDGQPRLGVDLGFNPRAPMGRDSVSCLIEREKVGFNPRAPMGRDRRSSAKRRRAGRFNPRAPMGRDYPNGGKIVNFVVVSTHAPLWGATGPGARIEHRGYRFNPRAPMGRDMDFPGWYQVCTEFQTTRPYGARPKRGAKGANAHGFNPRAPMGRDYACGKIDEREWEFQPTRPYGARRCSAVAMAR